MIEDLDTLLADLQASVPRDKTSAPSADSDDADGYARVRYTGHVANARASQPAVEQVHIPKPPSPSTQSATGTNLAALDSLLDSLNAFSDADLQLEPGEVSPLGGETATSGMASAGGRPDVDNLIDDLEDAVGDRNVNSRSPTHASSATRDLDRLMRSLQLTSMQMSNVPAAGTASAAGPAHSQSGSDSSDLIYDRPRPVGAPRPSVDAATTSVAKVDATATTDGGPANGAAGQSSAARLSQLDKMLGHLQSDISRQGINTAAKGTCSGCQKPIVGQVITALGRTWHPEHFVCVQCGQELARQNFFEKEGKAYCEKDYHELFAPRCGHCNGPILDRCMTALGKTWHPEHFFCAHCGRQFGPSEGFHEKDGRPYCREDYFELFAPKCGACDRPILDSFVSALGKQWHPECFNCMECGQPFQGGNFFEHEMKPYCEKHYYNHRGAFCYECKQSISGRCMTAMGRKYHPEHFVCAFCVKQLNQGTFKEQNDKPYCMSCYAKLFG